MLKQSLSVCAGLLMFSSSFAAVPTAKEIISTITNLEDSNANPPKAISIEHTKAIKLKSGEVAYLSGVSYENAGRNFWSGYILTRPKLKQSQILEYGGQSNEFKIYNVQPKTKPIQLIELSLASSGQGATSRRDELVYFDGWEAYVVATAESSSDLGRYSEVLGEEDCKTGHEIASTMKVVPQENYILITTKTANACNGAKVTVKEAKVPFNIR